MMRDAALFLGMDGGATKTEVIVANAAGDIRFHRIYGGSSYAVLGEAEFGRRMTHMIHEATHASGATPQNLVATTIGIPTYGEIQQTEDKIPRLLHALLPFGQLSIVNDAEVSWAGSLVGRTGIHVASGTGAIAFGVDPAGNRARAGGWSNLFADEGSCSWIGIRTMALFFKQSDGRLPRTPLYEIFRQQFGLKEKDIYFTGILADEFGFDPSRYAQLQRLAYKAWLAGDGTIPALYDEAARELSLLVRALLAKLNFPDGPPVAVSYSGGLFQVGELVVEPFRRHLSGLHTQLVRPQYPPGIGAVAHAARKHLPSDALSAMLRRIASSIDSGM